MQFLVFYDQCIIKIIELFLMDLSVLNNKQHDAVTAPLGPVLVLAGAGSGKTRVLAYRIAYLIEQGLVKAENILALTFTNKAAKEMQERVKKLLTESKSLVGMPTMGTFHSVCARILRKEITILGYSSGFTILDADDQLKIIKEICQELAIGKNFSPNLFRSFISSAKNLVQTPDDFNIGLEKGLHSLAQRVYVEYQNFLFHQNSLDFDDLIMLTIKLFEVKRETLSKYQNLFQYILVDEYQDTNKAQYVLLHLLASHDNLFVVGDDAQSIYGFRGSNIGNILSFENDHPNALVYKLEQNYRSTQHILAVADNVIALNSEQKPKKLWTQNEAGQKIYVYEAEDERDEGLFVAKKIINLASGKDGAIEPENEVVYEEEVSPSFSILDHFLKGKKNKSNIGSFGFGAVQLPAVHGPLSGFAVLYRTHTQSRAIEEAFINAGIPYQIIGGVKFYERKEIKDMLAYMRLIQNYSDLVSLKRVINEPSRGIGEKSYSIIKQFVLNFKQTATQQDLSAFRQALGEINLPPKQFEATSKFFWLIEEFSLFNETDKLINLMKLIFKKSGLEEWLNDGTENGEQRIENVKELFNVALKWDNLSWQEALQEFLEEVALVTEIDNLEESKDAVTLMTLHSAKGLEFENVFFVGLEEGILPHSRSLLDPSELAEEVRLAYVGVTRARRRLFLIYAKWRRVFGNLQNNLPSRILRALPDSSINSNSSSFKMGDEGVSYEPF